MVLPGSGPWAMSAGTGSEPEVPPETESLLLTSLITPSAVFALFDSFTAEPDTEAGAKACMKERASTAAALPCEDISAARADTSVAASAIALLPVLATAFALCVLFETLSVEPEMTAPGAASTPKAAATLEEMVGLVTSWMFDSAWSATAPAIPPMLAAPPSGKPLPTAMVLPFTSMLLAAALPVADPPAEFPSTVTCEPWMLAPPSTTCTPSLLVSSGPSWPVSELTAALVSCRFCTALVVETPTASMATPLAALLLVAPASVALPVAAIFELLTAPPTVRFTSGPPLRCADTVPWPDCAFCTLKAALVASALPVSVAPDSERPEVSMLLPVTFTVLPVARLP